MDLPWRLCRIKRWGNEIKGNKEKGWRKGGWRNLGREEGGGVKMQGRRYRQVKGRGKGGSTG